MKTFSYIACANEVKALRRHEENLPDVCEACADKAGVPVSEVDATSFTEWVHVRKPYLLEVETDVRDAKRRINLAKGPRNKKASPEDPQHVASDEEDAASVDG